MPDTYKFASVGVRALDPIATKLADTPIDAVTGVANFEPSADVIVKAGVLAFENLMYDHPSKSRVYANMLPYAPPSVPIIQLALTLSVRRRG